MVRIKKIALSNFKGIKPRTVFHFDEGSNRVNILAGPNGFGKTTVFDVIEVCLTGMFKRVDIFDGVQRKNYNKSKPFFQNTDGEDVILKLWLEDTSTSTSHIIIKHYNDATAPARVDEGRTNIPRDGAKMFTTYLTTETRYFDSDDFSQLQAVNRSPINSLFFGERSNTDLSASYYLFNYIQQEDSIYFLRKNEDDKGASLGFLFNIEKEELEKEKLVGIRKHLQDQNARIEQQIASIREGLPDADKKGYQRVFSHKEIDFDGERPFAQISAPRERLAQYEGTLNNLINFRTTFNIAQYEKHLKFKKLNEEVLNSDSLLNAFLFKRIYTPDLIAYLESINSKIGLASVFSRKSDTELIEKVYFDNFLNSEEEYRSYQDLEIRIKEVDKQLGDLGTLTVELSANRKKVMETFTQIRTSHSGHLSDKNCPLCDTLFESLGELNESIEAKTASILEFNSLRAAERLMLLTQLAEFYQKLIAASRKFVGENKVTESEVLSLIRNAPNSGARIDAIVKEFPEFSEEGVTQLQFAAAPASLEEVKQKKEALKNYIEKVLLIKYAYDEATISNKQFYVEYFTSSSEVFSQISVEALQAKLAYLRSEYASFANERLKFLVERKAKLTILLTKVDEIHDIIHPTIQQHKADLIENIKIPFYIYSGKILQSYQQGLGIFVEIHQTGLPNNVRFKTGHQSDHDIVYHLSSGQMAVVSLAFCLSLNKVYNTNDNFRFLSIDDPIQTMDDLNVHTFIELIRNEFANYQMIFSTHDDFTSRYMKYKFDKFDMPTQIHNIQKLVLDQAPI